MSGTCYVCKYSINVSDFYYWNKTMGISDDPCPSSQDSDVGAEKGTRSPLTGPHTQGQSHYYSLPCCSVLEGWGRL